MKELFHTNDAIVKNDSELAKRLPEVKIVKKISADNIVEVVDAGKGSNC